MLDEIKISIEEVLAPYCHDKGIDLVEIKVQQLQGAIAVKVLADKEEKIKVDECASLNRFLSEQIEERSMISGDYSVEVSSPGVDRPLKTKEDFSRVIGQQVQFYFREKVAGKLELCGVVQKIDLENVMVQVNDITLTISLDLINKAVCAI